jgi:hypothetical protein
MQEPRGQRAHASGRCSRRPRPWGRGLTRQSSSSIGVGGRRERSEGGERCGGGACDKDVAPAAEAGKEAPEQGRARATPVLRLQQQQRRSASSSGSSSSGSSSRCGNRSCGGGKGGYRRRRRHGDRYQRTRTSIGTRFNLSASIWSSRRRLLPPRQLRAGRLGEHAS